MGVEKSGSAERMRRKRLRDSGYEGKEAPVSKEKIEEGISKSEMFDLIAWAEGVRKRQAELLAGQERARVDVELLRRLANGGSA